MKYYKESIIALFLLAVIYSKPNFLNEFINNPLGKLLVILSIITIGNMYGKEYAIVASLVMILLLHNVFEGMENNNAKETTENNENESDEENEENEENEDEHEDDHEDERQTINEEEHKTNEHNKSGKDQIDSEETLKKIVPSDAPQNENDSVEGFIGFSSCSACGLN